MDPVTHGMFGALLNGLGFGRKGALGTLVASSMLPDIDLLARLLGKDALLMYHRGITHSLLAMVLAPALVAYVVTWQKRGKDFVYFYALSFLGFAFHIYMDLTTKYGVQLFSPLDDTFFSLYQVFILDPVITGSLLLFVALSRKRKQWALPLARGVLALIVVYYGARVYLHDSASRFIARSLERHAIKNVSPVPGGVLRWWFVAAGEDGSMKTGVADLFMQRVYVHTTYPPQAYTDAMEASKGASSVRALLRFSRFPYVRQMSEGDITVVRWEDLTFAYLPGGHFVAEAALDNKGNIIKHGLEL
ncbi:metal-dependent hydrolase [Nitrospirota bacterium]